MLRVFTLGPVRVETDAGPLTAAWLDEGSGHVLKYLVTHRDRVVPADELIEVFWPAGGPGAMTSVREAVNTLRERLEPGRIKRAGSAFIAVRSDGYGLERHALWIDADEFEYEVHTGLRAAARGDRPSADALLESATARYRHHYLSDEGHRNISIPAPERQ